MLDLCNFKQKYAFDCTVASIFTVLKYYRIDLPAYDDLVKMSNCHRNHGTDVPTTIQMLERFGLRPEWKEFASTDDLYNWYKMDVPTLVSWFSPAPGPHTSIVSCVGEKNITLLDPATGKNRTMPLSVFRTVWFVLDPTVGARAAKSTPRKYVLWREAIAVFSPSHERRKKRR
jgi:ABC-type bacteriocin/lantibiotic exporter with double-glycine peptidase domain